VLHAPSVPETLTGNPLYSQNKNGHGLYLKHSHRTVEWNSFWCCTSTVSHNITRWFENSHPVWVSLRKSSNQTITELVDVMFSNQLWKSGRCATMYVCEAVKALTSLDQSTIGASFKTQALGKLFQCIYKVST